MPQQRILERFFSQRYDPGGAIKDRYAPMFDATKGRWIASPYPAGGVSALTDGANIATDANLGDIFTVTLGGNRTIDNPTNPVDGQHLIYRIKQDGTGSRTITWGSAFRFSGGTAPTLTTTASKTDYVAFRYNAADSKWDCTGYSLNF